MAGSSGKLGKMEHILPEWHFLAEIFGIFSKWKAPSITPVTLGVQLVSLKLTW